MRLTLLISILLLIGFLPPGCSYRTGCLSSSISGYSKEEATKYLERRVYCYYGTSSNSASKCNPNRFCLSIFSGEYGTIKELEEVCPGKYLLIVHWEGMEEDGPWTSSVSPESYEQIQIKYFVIQ
jgi:hypothetical protein